MRRFAPFAISVLALAATSHSGIHIEDMDRTCKPCTDFWRYVNGGWVDRNPIPARLRAWGTMAVLGEANRERTRTILDNAHGTKMGSLYESCMNQSAIDTRGLAPLKADFDRIDAVQTPAELNRLIAEFQMIAQPSSPTGNGPANGPFKLDSSIDSRHPGRVIARIVERDGTNGFSSVLTLPDREYYTKDGAKSQEIRDEYLKHIETMMPGPDAASGAKRILAFETQLATSVLNVADRRDPEKTYHLMDVAELNRLSPHFDWKLVLRTASLPEDTPINVNEVDLVKRFDSMLASVPLEDWKLWLKWRMLTNSAPLLSAGIAAEDFRFKSTVLNGVTEQLPRWQTCAAVIDRDMGDELGQAYMAKYFPPEAKRRMAALVENLRAAMRIDLEHADFLTAETRQQALKKLDVLRVKIGSKEKWDEYASFHPSAEYFENERAVWAADRRRELGKIGKPVDKGDFNMTPPTVNAYSNSSQVEIVFPAGILQPPLFDMEADDAANYGAIGAVIGHEMGHQFDDNGSKYDSTGTLKNWWTPDDRAKFDARSACVVEQFNKLDVGEGRHHNGRLVLGEAMGDLGGLTVAYQAYQRALNGKPAPVLDGFTGDQRFFIAFARVWGSTSRPQAENVTLATNPHPLSKYRAIATLQNMPEFHRAFQCKPGDPMVRPASEQCKLW